MNIGTAFPSKYVKAAELPEEGVALTMARVAMEDVDGKGTHKPVLYFEKAKKGLVLNVTNSKKIQQIVGSAETDEWVGKKIVLYASETEYAGDTVPCIRVRAAKVPTSAKPIPAPAPPMPEIQIDHGAPLTDDDIPF